MVLAIAILAASCGINFALLVIVLIRLGAQQRAFNAIKVWADIATKALEAAAKKENASVVLKALDKVLEENQIAGKIQ